MLDFRQSARGRNNQTKSQMPTQTRRPSKHKRTRCSPSKRNTRRNTCYSDTALIQLRDAWNARHPDAIITSTSPSDIWKSLKEKLKNACSSEACWMRQQFAKKRLSKDIIAYTFAPLAPTKWKKKPSTWLTSDDITSVMKHAEHVHKDFEFFGPSPIDFDKRMQFGQCVWTDICNIQLGQLLARGKNKLGFIFNIDPHNKPGSHWVAMYIDVLEGEVTYMDSYGIEAPEQILKLYERLRRQAAREGINLKLNTIAREHQKGDSECGMYTLFFIMSLLEKKLSPADFERTRIPDNDMRALRKVYFRDKA